MRRELVQISMLRGTLAHHASSDSCRSRRVKRDAIFVEMISRLGNDVFNDGQTILGAESSRNLARLFPFSFSHEYTKARE